MRVRCSACGTDELVAFSCKGKSLCPSCAGRRMNDLALRLCDEVLPVAPYRQWVFSFPWRIRLALAYDSKLLSQVLAVCMRKVFAYQRRKARGLGVVAPQTLAVLFIQRFGSLIQLNPHGHAVLADGVFAKQPDGTATFVELGPPTQSELSAVGLAIVKAVVRVLARAGERAGDHDELALILSLSAAAVVGTTAHHRDRDDETDNGLRSSAKLATAIDSDLGRCRVAPAGRPTGALPRSGLGVFHHPALPSAWLADHGSQIDTTILGRGSGKRFMICEKRSQLMCPRWLRRPSHFFHPRWIGSNSIRRHRMLPLTPK
jgi:hypothetical protein